MVYMPPDPNLEILNNSRSFLRNKAFVSKINKRQQFKVAYHKKGNSMASNKNNSEGEQQKLLWDLNYLPKFHVNVSL